MTSRRRRNFGRPVRVAVASALAVAAGALAAPVGAGMHRTTTGSISGTIGPNATVGPLPSLDVIRARAKIVVTTPDGTAVGVLAIGTPRPDGAGIPRLPYSVTKLPLDVALQVGANGELTGAPDPAPSGFFYAFQLQKAYGSDGSFSYGVTLTRAHAVATGFDFIAEPIEIPPALQQPPAPSPSPTH